MSTGGGFVLEKDKVVPGWERVSGETDGWVVFFFPLWGRNHYTLRMRGYQQGRETTKLYNQLLIISILVYQLPILLPSKLALTQLNYLLCQHFKLNVI